MKMWMDESYRWLASRPFAPAASRSVREVEAMVGVRTVRRGSFGFVCIKARYLRRRAALIAVISKETTTTTTGLDTLYDRGSRAHSALVDKSNRAPRRILLSTQSKSLHVNRKAALVGMWFGSRRRPFSGPAVCGNAPGHASKARGEGKARATSTTRSSNRSMVFFFRLTVCERRDINGVVIPCRCWLPPPYSMAKGAHRGTASLTR